MDIKKRFSKCATILALTFTLGQSLLTPVQVMANGVDTANSTTVESQSDIDVNETKDQEAKEDLDTSEFSIPEVSQDLKIEQKNPIDQFLDLQPFTSSGYTTEGDVIEFRRGSTSLLRETGNSSGKLTKYYSSTAYISTPFITISGVENGTVWCIKPDKPFPVNIEYAKKVYNDLGVYNILYYAVENGWDQENENYVDVFVALNAYLGHTYQGVDLNLPVFTSDPNVSYLLQKAKDKDAPTGNFDIENKIQTADFDKTNKIQKTQWYTPTFDGSNVTYDIPTNELDKAVTVELSDGTSFTGQSGTKTIAANVKFRLTAPANYTKKISFTVQATFFARQGKFKLKKMSEISNLPMSEVGFKVTMSTGEVLELESNENGETPESKDFDFGTTGEVTEVKTPAGYVKLASPIKFTVEAGTTIEVAIENKIQKGEFTFQKFEEVYKPQETWDAGKPMYDRTPAANREFDLVRENDHTLPDGKTIVGKAGEVVDHIVTDKDGNGSSNVELFIGSQNKYKLVETNTPENYRDPSDIQTEFSIPYGNNTEKLVLFDQGEIDNELKTVNLTFNKKNVLDLAGLNLTGAQFLVQGLTNDVKFMFTTESASTLLKLLADKGTATYSFTEVKRPDGFDLVPGTTDTRIVTVTEGKDMTIDWENMPKAQKVGISTQAHTGDGSSQTFVWGEDATFYDDSNLTHENIPTGTKRKKEVKLHALYEDGTSAIVWKSGLVDYTVIDKEMTERTIAEYDYKKDPKATPNTRWYFSEDGYDKDGKKDTEHNPDGKDAKQDIKPILKETQATPKTSTTPTKTGTLPTTGEMIQSTLLMIGLMVVAVAGLLFQKKYELD
jgi:LPXTG-motif cell wall-anchored protein